MTISIGVVALNEEKFLPRLLEDIKNQTYNHDLIEVVLVDGLSIDKTKTIMQDFAKNEKTFQSIKVLDNPKKIQSAGWNIVIDNASCDVVVRIDAHSHIPVDFIQKNMELQETGEMVTGGPRPCIIENSNAWRATLLEVENSLFGSSINRKVNIEEKTYVKTMFHAAYRKEVFEKAGKFNENLLRTEDNELHYRISKAGYRFCYSSGIKSYQYARGNFRKMIKQKYGNGNSVGSTLWVCPRCLSIVHFIPFVFVFGVVVTTILAMFSFWHLAAFMWSLYFLFTAFGTICTVLNKKTTRWTFLMPILFLILHISYGIGTLFGLFKLPLRKKNALNV